MSETKYKRDKKKQLGQFMTPESLSWSILKHRQYKITDKILEPSFGKGSFLFGIIKVLLNVYPNELNLEQKLDLIFENNLFGVEFDKELYDFTINEIQVRYNYKLKKHNLINSDFFLVNYDIKFNYCEGNPPFGGTFETKFGEDLDKKFGSRNGEKIKKETYSFFTIKCFELLEDNGELGFICSDTFLSISTMKGLRKFLMDYSIEINKLSTFSEETDYGMVYFRSKKNNEKSIKIDNIVLDINDIYKTKNLSFLISNDYMKYFQGVTISKYLTCSSGMTTGKNELFLRDLTTNYIIEKYDFNITEEVKTYEKELLRTKLGKISANKLSDIENNVVENILNITPKNQPSIIEIPNSDYLPYNKSTASEIYEIPKTYVYWRNDGEVVKLFKKTGPWYLHGVGGEKFFKKEGLTWRLISNDIRVRYLPQGYILDSGSPIGVINEGIDKDELYFIIGWLLTPLSSEILKNVLNHTKNIQSKDIERMPYPSWVNNNDKKIIIDYVKELIDKKMKDENIDLDYKNKLNKFFIL